MMLFDSLFVGVKLYGMELFGWKESTECERTQLKDGVWIRKDTLQTVRC